MGMSSEHRELSVRLARASRWGAAYRTPRKPAPPSAPELGNPTGGAASVRRLDGARRPARRT